MYKRRRSIISGSDLGDRSSCCPRSSMDYIPCNNIFQFDQPNLNHHGELLQISCVPRVEYNIIQENHVAPLPHSTANDQDHHSRQINFSQPKRSRKASITIGENIADDQILKESKKIKKMMHRDIERQRRQEMATLYASLRSFLPLEYLKGKRSISDHVLQAENFIKHLQANIEELHEKRDQLKPSCIISNGVEISQSPSVMGDSTILVRPTCIGVEVVVNTPLKQGLLVSRVIDLLVAEGLGIVSCNSAKVKERLIYTLESETSVGRSVDIPELQNRLMKKSTSAPGSK